MILCLMSSLLQGDAEFDGVSLRNWRRIESYATRARTLTTEDIAATFEESTYGGKLFGTMAMYRREQEPLLPNLRELTIGAEEPRYLFFAMSLLHRGVTHLTLDLKELKHFHHEAKAEMLFELLPRRCPDLVSFTIKMQKRNGLLTSYNDMGAFELMRALKEVLPQLGSLQRVELPCPLVTATFEIVSLLPQLQAFVFEDTTSADMIDELYPDLSEGSFTSLEEASWNLTWHEAFRMFAQPQCIWRLTKLKLTTWAYEGMSDLPDAMETIASSCPSLTTLSLICHLKQENNDDITVIPDHIDFSDFEALCRLPLQEFEIRHPMPLEITDGDVQTMTQKWPDIRRLILNDSPMENLEATPAVTLASLALLTRSCRKLRKLGLYLDATTVPDFTAPPTADASSAPSSHIEYSLAFGASHITDVSRVTVALTHLFPRAPKLELGVTVALPGPTAVQYPLVGETRTRVIRWAEVSGVMPIVYETAAQQESDVARMQQEMERMRSEIQRLGTIVRERGLEGPDGAGV